VRPAERVYSDHLLLFHFSFVCVKAFHKLTIMNENLTTNDWTAARGEKWLAQLAGMEAMLAPVDEPLIGALNLDAPLRIADVGCGGGGTSLEILRRAPAGSVVHGFDLSPALIELALTRKRSDEPSLAFEVADVATKAAGQRYDRLVSRFGIMFFDDPTAAFTNMARWLVPGGQLAFAVWGRPLENPWMTTVRQVVAETIDLPPSDPDAPGLFRYADADKLLALLERAGLAELKVSDWRGALMIGGGLPAAEAANFALASFASYGELLAEAGAAALRDAQQLLTERWSRHQQDGVVRIDACVHIFTGARSVKSN
jgi:SAM-dependent methyltransferase